MKIKQMQSLSVTSWSQILEDVFVQGGSLIRSPPALLIIELFRVIPALLPGVSTDPFFQTSGTCGLIPIWKYSWNRTALTHPRRSADERLQNGKR